MENPSQPPSFATSLRTAVQGLAELVLTERNIRIDIAVSLLALEVSILTRTRGVELLIVFVLIGAVLAAEGLNTALEAAVDLVMPQRNEQARRAKDTAAGAVLALCLVAVVVGLSIFVPKLLVLFRGYLRLSENQMPPLALCGALFVAFLGWCAVHPLHASRDVGSDSEEESR